MIVFIEFLILNKRDLSSIFSLFFSFLNCVKILFFSFVIEKYNEVVAKKAEEERKAKTPAKTNSKKKTKKIKVAQKGAW